MNVYLFGGPGEEAFGSIISHERDGCVTILRNVKVSRVAST